MSDGCFLPLGATCNVACEGPVDQVRCLCAGPCRRPGGSEMVGDLLWSLVIWMSWLVTPIRRFKRFVCCSGDAINDRRRWQVLYHNIYRCNGLTRAP